MPRRHLSVGLDFPNSLPYQNFKNIRVELLFTDSTHLKFTLRNSFVFRASTENWGVRADPIRAVHFGN